MYIGHSLKSLIIYLVNALDRTYSPIHATTTLSIILPALGCSDYHVKTPSWSVTCYPGLDLGTKRTVVGKAVLIWFGSRYHINANFLFWSNGLCLCKLFILEVR